VLSGSGKTSSANVVLNKPFTNGIEFAINETFAGGTHDVGIFSDASGNANIYMLNITQNRLPLSIPDPYGYNQFNHPSIYFNETGVFGHKWWMFITPYAYSNGTYENACLYYSDDGLVWHVPPGVKNPIGTPIKSEYSSNAYGSDPYGSDPHGNDPYGSDSHLIYNPDTGKFMLYYVIGDVCGNATVEDP
jgi:hypothetical protein